MHVTFVIGKVKQIIKRNETHTSRSIWGYDSVGNTVSLVVVDKSAAESILAAAQKLVASFDEPSGG